MAGVACDKQFAGALLRIWAMLLQCRGQQTRLSCPPLCTHQPRCTGRRYNLSLGIGLADVKGKVFRIGHLGNMDELMLSSALCGAEMALIDAGVPVTPGGDGRGRGFHARPCAGRGSGGGPTMCASAAGIKHLAAICTSRASCSSGHAAGWLPHPPGFPAHLAPHHPQAAACRAPLSTGSRPPSPSPLGSTCWREVAACQLACHPIVTLEREGQPWRTCVSPVRQSVTLLWAPLTPTTNGYASLSLPAEFRHVLPRSFPSVTCASLTAMLCFGDFVEMQCTRANQHTHTHALRQLPLHLRLSTCAISSPFRFRTLWALLFAHPCVPPSLLYNNAVT